MHLSVFAVGGREALEGRHEHVLNVRVELVAFLGIVSSSVKTDSHSSGRVSDALGPDELVHRSVDSHIPVKNRASKRDKEREKKGKKENTNLVPIIFTANFLISRRARGARFLKVIRVSRLCRLMV